VHRSGSRTIPSIAPKGVGIRMRFWHLAACSAFREELAAAGRSVYNPNSPDLDVVSVTDRNFSGSCDSATKLPIVSR
jgi:hypothetical protein